MVFTLIMASSSNHTDCVYKAAPGEIQDINRLIERIHAHPELGKKSVVVVKFPETELPKICEKVMDSYVIRKVWRVEKAHRPIATEDNFLEYTGKYRRLIEKGKQTGGMDKKNLNGLREYANEHISDLRCSSIEEAVEGVKRNGFEYPQIMYVNLLSQSIENGRFDFSCIQDIFTPWLRSSGDAIHGFGHTSTFLGTNGTIFPIHFDRARSHFINLLLMVDIDPGDLSKGIYQGCKYWGSFDLCDEDKIVKLIQKQYEQQEGGSHPGAINEGGYFPLSLDMFKENGINCTIIRQDHGDLVIGVGAHFGWNSGVVFNQTFTVHFPLYYNILKSRRKLDLLVMGRIHVCSKSCKIDEHNDIPFSKDAACMLDINEMVRVWGCTELAYIENVDYLDKLDKICKIPSVQWYFIYNLMRSNYGVSAFKTSTPWKKLDQATVGVDKIAELISDEEEETPDPYSKGKSAQEKTHSTQEKKYRVSKYNLFTHLHQSAAQRHKVHLHLMNQYNSSRSDLKDLISILISYRDLKSSETLPKIKARALSM